MKARNVIPGLAEFATSLNVELIPRMFRLPNTALVRLLGMLYPAEEFRQSYFVRKLLPERAGDVTSGFLSAESLLAQYELELQQRRDETYRGEINQARALYVLCRVMRPLSVVETGVASGLSSCYILKALHDNEAGSLVSVDLPNYEQVLSKTVNGYYPVSILPDGKGAGWLVPEELRRKWNLVVGRSQDVLEGVLARCGDIDLFLHDSEHTYECMTFEYRAAWNHLRPGGILLSDDVWLNDAFLDFAIEVGRSPVIIGGGLGGMRK